MAGLMLPLPRSFELALMECSYDKALSRTNETEMSPVFSRMPIWEGFLHAHAVQPICLQAVAGVLCNRRVCKVVENLNKRSHQSHPGWIKTPRGEIMWCCGYIGEQQSAASRPGAQTSHVYCKCIALCPGCGVQIYVIFGKLCKIIGVLGSRSCS